MQTTTTTILRAAVAGFSTLALALSLTGCASTASNDRAAGDAPPPTRDAKSQFTADGTGTTGVNTAKSGKSELVITKKLPETVVLGKTITYDINVTNPGDGALSGVTVSEGLPEGFEFVSSEPSAKPSGDDGRTLNFDYDSMAPGAKKTIKITGTPQKAGALQACTSYDFKRGVCVAMNVVNPQLRLVKSGPEQAGLCQDVTYTYVVSNSGQDAAKDVTLYDKLPAGLTADGKDAVSLKLGDIAPGQDVRKAVTVEATQPGTFGSYAAAKSDLNESKSQTVQTTFVAPALDVQVRADRGTEYVGKNARFDVIVKNTGKVASPQTRLKLGMEGQAKLVGVTGVDAGKASGDTVDVGALEPGQSRNMTVTVTSAQEGQVSLAAVAESVCPNREGALARAQDSAAVRFDVLSALQVEVVDKADPVQVGSNTVYEITIINEGTGPDRNLKVSAVLPDGLTYVGGEGSTPITVDGKNLTMAPLATIPAGEKATWYVTAKADTAKGATKFQVFAQSDGVPDRVEEDEPTTLY